MILIAHLFSTSFFLLIYLFRVYPPGELPEGEDCIFRRPPVVIVPIATQQMYVPTVAPAGTWILPVPHDTCGRSLHTRSSCAVDVDPIPDTHAPTHGVLHRPRAHSRCSQWPNRILGNAELFFLLPPHPSRLPLDTGRSGRHPAALPKARECAHVCAHVHVHVRVHALHECVRVHVHMLARVHVHMHYRNRSFSAQRQLQPLTGHSL